MNYRERPFSKALYLIFLVQFFFSFCLQAKLYAQDGKTINASISANLNEGLWIQSADSTLNVRLGFRFQEQFNGSRNLNMKRSDSEFQIRRFRLIFSGNAINQKLSWFFMPSFDRGNASLEIVRVKWRIGQSAWIYAGQINMPGTREFLQSSGSLQFVDRSEADRLFRLGYDTGIGLKKVWNIERFALVTTATITNGEGQNQRASKGGLSYTGRLDLYPFGQFNSLIGTDFNRSSSVIAVFSGALNFNEDAKRTRSHAGNFLENASADVFTLFLDASLRFKGASLHSGYVRRWASDNLLQDGNPQNFIFEGGSLNVEGGYLLVKNWEIVTRFERTYATSQLKSIIDERRIFLAGLNRFILKHKIKFQTDIGYQTTYRTDKSETNSIIARAQFQFEF